MALRTFTGTDGTVWNVWNVVPTTTRHPSLTLGEALVEGWLCFECPTEKRRVFPIPAGWEEWPPEELERCLAAAPPVPARAPRSSFPFPSAAAPAPPADAVSPAPGDAG